MYAEHRSRKIKTKESIIASSVIEQAFRTAKVNYGSENHGAFAGGDTMRKLHEMMFGGKEKAAIPFRTHLIRDITMGSYTFDNDIHDRSVKPELRSLVTAVKSKWVRGGCAGSRNVISEDGR